MGNPDQGECKLTCAWHIQTGHHESTELHGLNVAAIFNTPGNMLSGPKWKAALYLDERATKEQANALAKIYSGQAGGFFGILAGLIGETAGVRAAPIKFEINGKSRSLHIPSVLDLTIEGITGGDQKTESTISNPQLYGAPGFPITIAKSIMHSFSDFNIQWDNSGKNGFYSRFAYSP
jgi:hypothetical protein